MTARAPVNRSAGNDECSTPHSGYSKDEGLAEDGGRDRRPRAVAVGENRSSWWGFGAGVGELYRERRYTTPTASCSMDVPYSATGCGRAGG